MADVKQEHNKTDDVDAYGMGNSADPKNMQELTQYKFFFLDEMGNRIDDLEKNIADLMTQAGVEGGEK
ncbi:hypothetical protein HZH68_007052 [Vespula germanica]|uniref:Uncharacterized protein n=1 Tax=Vespula germanica TaxID=30212 RepID=A0A834K8C3_VESGE|nr:hypothetical protein HZH68_007052 [Vespula germanica]